MSNKNNNQENISKKEIQEFKNLSFKNKSDLMYKKARFSIDDIEYEPLIKGIGQKAVKLELYLDYERILKNKDVGSIENKLFDKIMTIYEKGKPINTDKEV